MVMDGEDYERLLAEASRLAADTSRIILDRWHRVPSRRKADGSEVTDADLAAEEHIIETLRRSYPDHDIIGEESGLQTARDRRGRYCWAVDPLDGTRNYARGFPCFATSIALLDDGVPVVGVVREHVTARTYSAAAGRGATVDGLPLAAACRPMDRDFLVGAPSAK